MNYNRFHWKMKRIAKKITLKEIADEIGCSIALVSKYENEKRNMSSDKVKQYEEYIENKYKQ